MNKIQLLIVSLVLVSLEATAGPLCDSAKLYLEGHSDEINEMIGHANSVNPPDPILKGAAKNSKALLDSLKKFINTNAEYRCKENLDDLQETIKIFMSLLKNS